MTRPPTVQAAAASGRASDHGGSVLIQHQHEREETPPDHSRGVGIKRLLQRTFAVEAAAERAWAVR